MREEGVEVLEEFGEVVVGFFPEGVVASPWVVVAGWIFLMGGNDPSARTTRHQGTGPP